MKEFNIQGMYPSKNEVLEFSTSDTQMVDDDNIPHFTSRYIYFATSMGNLIHNNIPTGYFRCIKVKDYKVVSDTYEYFMELNAEDKYEDGKELINFLLPPVGHSLIKVFNISNRKGFKVCFTPLCNKDFEYYILPCSVATWTKHNKISEQKKKVESFVPDHK